MCLLDVDGYIEKKAALCGENTQMITITLTLSSFLRKEGARGQMVHTSKYVLKKYTGVSYHVPGTPEYINIGMYNTILLSITIQQSVLPVRYEYVYMYIQSIDSQMGDTRGMIFHTPEYELLLYQYNLFSSIHPIPQQQHDG